MFEDFDIEVVEVNFVFVGRDQQVAEKPGVEVPAVFSVGNGLAEFVLVVEEFNELEYAVIESAEEHAFSGGSIFEVVPVDDACFQVLLDEEDLVADAKRAIWEVGDESYWEVRAEVNLLLVN